MPLPTNWMSRAERRERALRLVDIASDPATYKLDRAAALDAYAALLERES